ncbi:MAG: adenosyl-hopene transferase HpnH [Thermodesulfobacteriota bacterium]|nr:MAG: adenosyl-hopene transferase HpnH [Thermodesulfobacteriota bacterium]
MAIPFIQKLSVGKYIMKQRLRGNGRYPLVLMLEPLFQCNLSCAGCGKINYPEEILKRRLSVDECLEAARECGAPVVSIPGGEPLMHPEIHSIARGLTAQKRFVYLCTNAILLKRKIDLFEPSAYLTFSIHLDGSRDRHDSLVGRAGVFDNAVEAIALAKKRGFRVTTNTTVYSGETIEESVRFFDFLNGLGVEGMTVSPAFNYGNAREKKNFLEREKTKTFFCNLISEGRRRGWHFNHSSLFLDFLAGNQDYRCTPWGNPTRNIFGWQRPCYLLEEGYANTFRELVEETDWERYGFDRNPKCADCMVHCGYEPTAVMDTVSHPLKALIVKVRGVKTKKCHEPLVAPNGLPPKAT